MSRCDVILLTKRIEVRKLNWRAESKIMNNNLDYKKKALQVSMENGIDKTPKVSVGVGWSAVLLVVMRLRALLVWLLSVMLWLWMCVWGCDSCCR